MGALTGMHVALACPPGYEPDPVIIQHAQQLAAAGGGSVTLTNDPFEAVAGADVVSTDTWVSMGISGPPPRPSRGTAHLSRTGSTNG